MAFSVEVNYSQMINSKSLKAKALLLRGKTCHIKFNLPQSTNDFIKMVKFNEIIVEMRKHASTWIEGDGTVRTVFRIMALWAYTSNEKAKLQLVRVIERKGDVPGPFILQYAIDRRKKEIQWISIYSCRLLYPFSYKHIPDSWWVVVSETAKSIRQPGHCPVLGILF